MSASSTSETQFSRLKVALVAAGVFPSVMGGGMANLAFPAMVQTFHVSYDAFQWRNIVFFVLFAASMPVFGALADRFGAARVYMAGSLLLCVSALGSALSNRFGLFVAFQGLYALGDGMIVPSQMAVLQKMAPKSQMGQAFGIFQAVMATAELLGPPTGGAMLTFLPWRSIFFFQAGLCMVIATGMLLAVIPSLPAMPGEKSGTLPPLPSALLLAGLLLAVKASLMMQNKFAVFVACLFLAGLILTESKAVKTRFSTLLPAIARTNSAFLLASLRIFLVFLVVNAIFLYLPAFMAASTPLGVGKSGLILMAAPLLSLLVASKGGAFADRKPNLALNAGLLLAVAGLVFYLQPGGLAAGLSFPAGLLLGALGGILITPAQMIQMTASTPQGSEGSFTGFYLMVQFLTGAAASLVFGPIVGGNKASLPASGFHLLIYGCVAIYGVLIAMQAVQGITKKAGPAVESAAPPC